MTSQAVTAEVPGLLGHMLGGYFQLVFRNITTIRLETSILCTV